jgi:uncharacterized phage-associated protein
MIYGRQIVLLEMLRQAGRPLGKTQLMKLLFLLKTEQTIDRYIPFYDFVPYKHGPFSFVIYRDLDYLEAHGLVETASERVVCTGRGLRGESLPATLARMVEATVSKYGRLPLKRLVDYVYTTYPWYASRSELGPRAGKARVARTARAVYTIGYEGMSIDEFLAVLLRKGIRRIIDTRNSPLSRKYGFSAETLQRRCEEFGVEYCGFPQLGIPSTVRHRATGEESLWGYYRRTVISKSDSVLAIVSSACLEAPSALLCFESDPRECHRHILAGSISDRTDLPIIHFRREKRKWLKECAS